MIKRDNEKAVLVFTIGLKSYNISLTDDNPGEVKAVFNHLITELKNGKFSFSLVDDTKDLYYYICDEYIKQLNGEIADVYSQLKKNELICTVE